MFTIRPDATTAHTVHPAAIAQPVDSDHPAVTGLVADLADRQAPSGAQAGLLEAAVHPVHGVVLEHPRTIVPALLAADRPEVAVRLVVARPDIIMVLREGHPAHLAAAPQEDLAVHVPVAAHLVAAHAPVAAVPLVAGHDRLAAVAAHSVAGADPLAAVVHSAVGADPLVVPSDAADNSLPSGKTS